MTIIDAHVHVWSDDRLRFPFGPHDEQPVPDGSRSPEAWAETGRPVGVTDALLIQPRVYGYDHAYLYDAARAAPGTFRVMPLINVMRDTAVADLRARAADPLTAGARVIALGAAPAHWLVSGEADRVWTEMALLRLPVGFLIDPEQIPFVERIATGHPDLTVVIDHMARIRPGHGADRLPALLALAALPNVVVKLSAVGAPSAEPREPREMQTILGPLIDRFGPRRLAWGSDWPHVAGDNGYANGLAVTCDALDSAGVDRDEVLRGTASRTFGFTR